MLFLFSKLRLSIICEASSNSICSSCIAKAKLRLLAVLHGGLWKVARLQGHDCVRIGARRGALVRLYKAQVQAQADMRTITLARNTARMRAHPHVSLLVHDGAWCQSWTCRQKRLDWRTRECLPRRQALCLGDLQHEGAALACLRTQLCL